jgi:catechol 2,3-dioxygenase-like lactoylglutathione lyase family enzyme/DNA-binding CsgD family transcriptional regulator
VSSQPPRRPRRPRGRPPYPDVLTPTEWRVLHWIRHGLRRKAIGKQVGTSENAIKYHVANIGSKLGVSGIAALRQWPGYPVGGPLARRSPSMTASIATTTTATTDPTPASGPTSGPVGPLGQVSLWARDVTTTERFYRDTLGLPHIFTFGALAFFDMGGVRLYVHCVPDADWKPSSVLYFRVDDIDATMKTLTAAGVPFVGQPHLIHRDDATGDEEWMAFFEDPDRNMLALMSKLAAPD